MLSEWLVSADWAFPIHILMRGAAAKSIQSTIASSKWFLAWSDYCLLIIFSNFLFFRPFPDRENLSAELMGLGFRVYENQRTYTQAVVTTNHSTFVWHTTVVRAIPFAVLCVLDGFSVACVFCMFKVAVLMVDVVRVKQRWSNICNVRLNFNLIHLKTLKNKFILENINNEQQ